jgi:hypothetical protein
MLSLFWSFERWEGQLHGQLIQNEAGVEDGASWLARGLIFKTGLADIKVYCCERF